MRSRGSLAGVVTVLAVLSGCGGGRQQQARPPAAPTTAPRVAPAPAPAGISDLHATSVTPFSATVGWKTGTDTRAWVRAGTPDGQWTIWRHETHPSREHAATIGGLTFSTPYRLQVEAETGGRPSGAAEVGVTTMPAPTAPTASAHDGSLWVDGNPFFPLMVFEQCPDTYSTSLQVGIDLFAGNRCGGLVAQQPALAGKALLAATADDRARDATATVGTFYPDEADGHGLVGASLPAPPVGGAGVRFLTLTSHFYSAAAPLPAGRTVYPSLVSRADVVGFDLYPLQGWCRPNRLPDVYRAQRELARLAGGKPTYQWIEAAGMLCPNGPTAVTPDTVRAEALLAVAGGARGLGFFPAAAWTGAVGAAIGGVTRSVRYLGPGLGGPDVAASVTSGSPVLAGARAFDGALYVIAVNPTYRPTQATVAVSGLGDRPLAVFDEGRTVASSGNSFTDSFAPLQSHVYVVAPAGS